MFGLRMPEDKLRFRKFARQYNALTRLLLKCCCTEGENVFISPLSILLLLGLMADSTAGKTREELMIFLGRPDFGLMLSRLQKELCGDPALSIANAVCVRKDIGKKVNLSYQDLQLRQYDAELFSSENIVRDVNEWVNRKTRGMICNAIPESAKDALLCLISAIAFQSDWYEPYEDEDVWDEVFHNADGTESRMWMLHGSEGSFYENDDFTGFGKRYEGSGLYFLALLPKQEGDEALSEALDRLDFTSLRSSEAIVRTKIPEFRFECSKELTALCKAFGVNEVFTDNADFSPATSESLKVESILHKAYIDVNQIGTKAAAVTMAVCCAGCAPRLVEEFREVYLDRPFVFAIMHPETKMPVFTGVVRHLENAKQDPERLKRKLGRAERLRKEARHFE